VKPEADPVKTAENIDLQIGSDRQLHVIKSFAATKAKVALVRAPLFFAAGAIGNEISPSIRLAYLNGYLRKFGYDPVLVDGQGDAHNRVLALEKYPGYQIQGLSFGEILAQLPKDIKIFGVSSMFSAEWLLTRDLVNTLKQHYPDSIIIAGGEHISATPEYSLRDCVGLDYCVCGEGEYVFLELCERISAGKEIDDVPGIAFLDENGKFIRSSGVTRIRNIDAIPWPYWPDGYLEKFWQSGKTHGVQTARDMPLLLTRGCPYQCTFCSSPEMWTTRYVMRSVDDVIAEIKTYYEKYRVTSFHIYDLTAITKRSWFLELLQRLVELNLPVEWSFPSGTRSEILDDEILGLLKKIGTSYIVYAPESGSEQTLKNIKKRISLTRVLASIDAARKVGIKARANFIIGFPDETRWDIYKTLWVALKCVIRGVDDVQPYLFNPYPGSELFNGFLATKQVTLDDHYYLSISSQNSDIFNLTPLTFNKHMSAWELGLYRMVMALSCYALSYLLYPSRIMRSVRNIRSGERADTVFESRLRAALNRKKNNRA
jgi:anaerobic magnesium-protoporphyrin IX monomethyl ester cyclase